MASWMKNPLDSHREFNTPAVMLARATFLATLAALAGGILLMIAGVVAWQPHWSVAGLGVVGLACVGRAWLQRRGEFAPAERALGEVLESGPPLDSPHAVRLMFLLEQWEDMEGKRGSAEFDPWALQALRNEIRCEVESDPALAELFRRLQRTE